MGLGTVYCPFTKAGVVETSFQAAGQRLVLDCRVKPAKLNPSELAGHVKVTDPSLALSFDVEQLMANRGGRHVRLNIVPSPSPPPADVAP